ncbi:tetratricopeptide repeat protein, partial [bacterium]|nr:tetratricopeptide repeat protein [bacterium]
LGYILLDQNQYKKAINYFNQALKLSPSDKQTVSVYTGLAACYKKAKNYPKAISYLRKVVLTISPDSKQYKNASEDFISTLLKYRLKKSSLSVSQIFSLLNEVKKHSQRNEDVLLDKYVWGLLDRCYKKLFRKSDRGILKILGKYNLSNDNTIFTHLFWGNFYFYKGNITRAKKEFLTILMINPDSPVGYTGLKNIYIEEKRPLEALKCFMKAKRIIGEKYSLPVYKNLTKIYKQIKNNETLENITKLFAVIKKIVPQYQDVLYCALGEIYLENDMLDKAEDCFSLGMKSQVSPNVAHRDWPYVELGKVYLKRGKYKLAKEYFMKALRMNSSSVQAMSNLGDFYFKQNQFDKAEKFYQQTIKQALEDDNEEEIEGVIPYVYLSLGDMAIKEGKRRKARRYYYKVLKYSNLDAQKEAKDRLAYYRLKALKK